MNLEVEKERHGSKRVRRMEGFDRMSFFLGSLLRGSLLLSVLERGGTEGVSER